MNGMLVLLLLAVVAVMAFWMGYVLGRAPIQEEQVIEEAVQAEVSANIRLILNAEQAKKEAAQARFLMECALARNAELQEEIVCLKSRL